ncbi:MAG TPA: DUF5615 family PIN-like protein [Pirellulales bacterium]|nr:DUF5615 family PIN-like protein [Pirellulales bacterium]
MRVLLDECVPRRLAVHLVGHEVHTVPEMGWTGKKNGELLELMSNQGMEIFLTTDQNLRYQQNLQTAGVAIVVLAAVSNRLADLIPLVPATLNALTTIKPGEILEIRS